MRYLSAASDLVGSADCRESRTISAHPFPHASQRNSVVSLFTPTRMAVTVTRRDEHSGQTALATIAVRKSSVAQKGMEGNPPNIRLLLATFVSYFQTPSARRTATSCPTW